MIKYYIQLEIGPILCLIDNNSEDADYLCLHTVGPGFESLCKKIPRNLSILFDTVF